MNMRTPEGNVTLLSDYLKKDNPLKWEPGQLAPVDVPEWARKKAPVVPIRKSPIRHFLAPLNPFRGRRAR
jgi:hypothetical protein